MKKAASKTIIPAQEHTDHGDEQKMDPQPVYIRPQKNKRLDGKVAIITGGDSGIGRAVAIAFAQEGATVVISYHADKIDANTTAKELKKIGTPYLLIEGDISQRQHCFDMVAATIKKFKKLDILVNNAAIQMPEKELGKITEENLRLTFETNIFAQFYLAQAAEPHLKEGDSIINTTSVTAYRGSPELLDYSSTKGAIVTFTRSLSKYFASKGIRVNGVAPGPIWTPLIPTTFPKEKVKTFGQDVPLGRAGQPAEVAPAYVFLASEDSSYMTGQVLHVNGGELING